MTWMTVLLAAAPVCPPLEVMPPSPIAQLAISAPLAWAWDLELSAEGQLASVTGASVELWDARSLRLLQTWRTRQPLGRFPFPTVSWSPDGRTLGLAERGASAFFELASGREEPGPPLDLLRLGPASHWAGVSAGFPTRFYEGTDGGFNFTPVNRQSKLVVKPAAMSADLSLAFGSETSFGSSFVWTLDRKGNGTPPVSLDWEVKGLGASDDGTRLVAVGEKFFRPYSVILRCAEPGCVDAGALDGAGLATAVAVLADGNGAVTVGPELSAWSLPDGELRWDRRPHEWIGSAASFVAVAVEQRRGLGVAKSEDGTLATFALSNGRLLSVTPAVRDWARRVRFAKSALLIDGGRRGWRWKLDGPVSASSEERLVPEVVRSLARGIDASGKLFTVMQQKQAGCPVGEEALVTLPPSPKAPCWERDAHGIFDPDSRRLLMGNQRGPGAGLSIVDLNTGGIRALPDSEGFMALGLGPNGAWGSKIGANMRVWRASGPAIEVPYQTPMFEPTVTALGRNRFAAATAGRVRVWSMSPVSPVADYTLSSRVDVLTFAGDDLVAGTAGGMLVQIRSGAAPVERDAGAPIHDIYLSPDCKLAATVGIDAVVRLWDLPSLRQRALFVGLTDGSYAAFTPAGAFTASPGAAELLGWSFGGNESFGVAQLGAALEKPELVAARAAGKDDEVVAPWRPPRVTLTGAPPTFHVSVESPGRVETVQLFAEGRPVSDAIVVCAAKKELDVPVVMPPGRNRVTAVAIDARGSLSNLARLDVTQPGKPSLYVVAVGVGDYPKLLKRNLPFAPVDARDLAQAFAAQAGEKGLFASPAQVTVLDTPERSRPDEIVAALEGLSAMEEGDFAVVFLSGHGAQQPNGELLFLTSQVELTGPSVKPAARAHVLPWARIAQALGKAKGRVLVLLDTCHAGAAMAKSSEMADALSGTRVRVWSASRADQESFGPKTDGPVSASLRSWFADALIGALSDRVTDSDGDGYVQLSELAPAVRRDVWVKSRGKQTPSLAPSPADFTLASLGSQP